MCPATHLLMFNDMCSVVTGIFGLKANVCLWDNYVRAPWRQCNAPNARPEAVICCGHDIRVQIKKTIKVFLQSLGRHQVSKLVTTAKHIPSLVIRQQAASTQAQIRL